MEGRERGKKKYSRLVSEIEIPAGERGRKGVRKKERRKYELRHKVLFFTHARTQTHTHTFTHMLRRPLLYREGIKEHDTLNIKAIVNTHGESAVSSRLSAPTITIFMCVCRCVHADVLVRVCVIRPVV